MFGYQIETTKKTVSGLPEVPRLSVTRLQSVQAGRGIAALLVVLYHATVFMESPVYWHTKPLGGLFSFGHSGVVFFFVLSGFIIFYVHRRDLGQADRLADYVRRRFMRVYPAYWIVLTVAVLAYWAVPSFGDAVYRTSQIIVSSYLLVHIVDETTILTVAWTLYHEIVFYTAFGLMIFRFWPGAIVVGVWFAGSALAAIVGFAEFPLRFYFSPMHLLFLAGMGVAWHVQTFRTPVPALVAAVGVAMFVLAGLDESFSGLLGDGVRAMAYGGGSAFAILGLIGLERQGRLRLGGGLLLLGDASYAIYLVHFMVISATSKTLLALGAGDVLPAELCFLVLAGIAVGAGIAFHLAIERPLLAMSIRRRAVRPSGRTS